MSGTTATALPAHGGSRTKTTVPFGASSVDAVERERRMARDDDVDLLMPERLLGVLLDHVIACRARAVRVDAERVDAERPAQRLPEHAGSGDRLDLRQPQHRVGLELRHRQERITGARDRRTSKVCRIPLERGIASPFRVPTTVT